MKARSEDGDDILTGSGAEGWSLNEEPRMTVFGRTRRETQADRAPLLVFTRIIAIDDGDQAESTPTRIRC